MAEGGADIRKIMRGVADKALRGQRSEDRDVRKTAAIIRRLERKTQRGK